MERRIETVISWPPQLDVQERTIIRTQVERTARERITADPRIKPATAQKVEIRVDQVNVRLDAPPQQPRPTPAVRAAESGLRDYFFSRALR